MDLTRNEMTRLIDQYIWSEQYREITKRRLLDHVRYEPLAEEFHLSVRQTKRIVYASKEILFRNIPVPENMLD